MSAEAVTAAYRRRILATRAVTYRDLLRIWPAFNPNDSDAVAAWTAGVRAVAGRDYIRTATLATEYEPLHAVASGADEIIVRRPEPFPEVPFETSARVTSLVAFRKAVGAGKSRDEALRIAFVRSSGAITRYALDGGRSVLMNTAVSNPQIAGWRRTGNPQCDWCKALIARGTVYRTSDSASFKAHDHCSCSAENVYTGKTVESRAFKQSDRFRTQAQRDVNNARIRAYLRTI